MGFLRTVIPLRYVIRLPLRYVIRLTREPPCELVELRELYELRELNRREPDSPDSPESRNSRNHDVSRESRLRLKPSFMFLEIPNHRERWRFKGPSVLAQRSYIAITAEKDRLMRFSATRSNATRNTDNTLISPGFHRSPYQNAPQITTNSPDDASNPNVGSRCRIRAQGFATAADAILGLKGLPLSLL